MDGEVIIREFNPGDMDMVNEFFDQMGPETRAFFNRGDGNRKTALEYFSGKAENRIYWLAECAGLMVGYVFLYEIHTTVPWLGIAVRDDFKGKHLGRRLIDTTKDYVTAHGRGGIMLMTHIANFRGQGLYERCGFERIGTHPSGEVMYIFRFDQK